MTTTTPATIAKLVELPLGQVGLNYVRSSLESETSFCREMLPFVMKRGTVFAVIPEGTSASRAMQFDTGGLVRTRFTDRWLVERMLSACRAHPEGVLVFDQPWGRRKRDRVVTAQKAPEFFHDDFVYHFVEAKDADEARIDTAMSSIGGFLFVAAFSLYPFVASKLPADLTVQDDQAIRNIVAQTQEVYISAYDHESYVVWRK
ncbi:MAG TPA: hypothetical protein VNF99_09355 [Stellaceae bacterium]|nr:hypothetical protein [Stellaceae bacterium]